MFKKFFCPTKIFYGEDSINEVANLLSSYDGKVLIISTTSAARISGAYSKVKEALDSCDLQYFYENSISQNPDVSSVRSISDKFKGKKISLIISIGGGSAMDAGKAISVCIGSGKSIDDLILYGVSGEVFIDHLAIPTTAGTGSELSKGSILSDKSKNWKGGLRGDELFPKFAVIDPALTYSLPKSITLLTGFDAFTHAFESYLSNSQSDITDIISLDVIKRIVPALLDIAEDINVYENKKTLAFCSMLAGINLANSSTCLPHRIQYAIGSLSDSTHSEGLVSVYPAWISSLKEAKIKRYFILTSIIDKVGGLDKDGPIEDLISRLGIARTLSDLGLNASHHDELVCLTTGNLQLDPCYNGKNTIYKILDKS